MLHIKDFERKVKYLDAFWEKEIIDRPLINIIAPKKPLLPVSYRDRMHGIF